MSQNNQGMVAMLGSVHIQSVDYHRANTFLEYKKSFSTRRSLVNLPMQTHKKICIKFVLCQNILIQRSQENIFKSDQMKICINQKPRSGRPQPPQFQQQPTKYNIRLPSIQHNPKEIVKTPKQHKIWGLQNIQISLPRKNSQIKSLPLLSKLLYSPKNSKVSRTSGSILINALHTDKCKEHNDNRTSIMVSQCTDNAYQVKDSADTFKSYETDPSTIGSLHQIAKLTKPQQVTQSSTHSLTSFQDSKYPTSLALATVLRDSIATQSDDSAMISSMAPSEIQFEEHNVWDNQDIRLKSLLLDTQLQPLQSFLSLYKARFGGFPGLPRSIQNEEVIVIAVQFASRNRTLFKKYFPQPSVVFEDHEDYSQPYDALMDDNFLKFKQYCVHHTLKIKRGRTHQQPQYLEQNQTQAKKSMQIQE